MHIFGVTVLISPDNIITDKEPHRKGETHAAAGDDHIFFLARLTNCNRAEDKVFH